MIDQNNVEPLCNLCGLTCVLGHDRIQDDPGCGPHGLIDQSVSGGYESTAGNGRGALDDMTWYRFSLCEFCLDWLFSQFKIAIKTGYYGGGCDDDEVPAWKPASQRVAEDDWRGMKKEFFEEHARRLSARNTKT